MCSVEKRFSSLKMVKTVKFIFIQIESFCFSSEKKAGYTTDQNIAMNLIFL